MSMNWSNKFLRKFVSVVLASLIFSTLLMTSIFFIGSPIVVLAKTGKLAFPFSRELLVKLLQFIGFMSSLMTACVMALDFCKPRKKSVRFPR